MSAPSQLTKNDVKLFAQYPIAESYLAYTLVGGEAPVIKDMTLIVRAAKFMHAKDTYLKNPTDLNLIRLGQKIEKLELHLPREEGGTSVNLHRVEALYKQLSSEGMSVGALIEKEGLPHDETRKPLKERFEAIMGEHFPEQKPKAKL